MEGPSLKILVEELAPKRGRQVADAHGTARLDFDVLVGRRLDEITSWGKHLLLRFGPDWLKIHFLLFGTYLLDEEKPTRSPTLALRFVSDGGFCVYTSSVKVLPRPPDDLYDWRRDVLGDAWDEDLAIQTVKQKPAELVCDVLLDQDVFAGSGNIVKNEVLYRLGLLPEVRVDQLTGPEIRGLVRETRIYCEQFLAWKKRGVLKKNWQVFRRRHCAHCAGPVLKGETGRTQRVSYWCGACQGLKERPRGKAGSCDLENAPLR